MQRFIIAKPAGENLKSIARYTERTWGNAQRQRYLASLYERFAFLAQFPGKGISRDELASGLRSFKEGKHLIFYFTQDAAILIVDILHESMDIDARMEGWTRE